MPGESGARGSTKEGVLGRQRDALCPPERQPKVSQPHLLTCSLALSHPSPKNDARMPSEKLYFCPILTSCCIPAGERDSGAQIGLFCVFLYLIY